MRSILTAGASGVFVADSLGNLIKPNLNSDVFEGKVIEERLLEIVLISASAYGVNKFVIGADNVNHGLIQKIGILVASDLISTYAVDYLNVSPLTFL